MLKIKNYIIIGALFIYNCASAESTNVYAAASMSPSLTKIVSIYKKSHKEEINLNFASSATLAKQIDQGAPATIFISANTKWMDYLETKQLIKNKKILLKNHLVLIATKDYVGNTIQLDSHTDFKTLLQENRLAIGDPMYVPVGIYAKQALLSIGAWKNVVPFLANASNARAALALVEIHEVELGIVYKTDALSSNKVKIIYEFADATHDKIEYPIAMIKPSGQNDFYNFLFTKEAQDIFEQYGFEVSL